MDEECDVCFYDLLHKMKAEMERKKQTGVENISVRLLIINIIFTLYDALYT